MDVFMKIFIGNFTIFWKYVYLFYIKKNILISIFRVVIQNERFDDWFPTLQQLKEIFANYKKSIIDYHKTIDESESIPEAFISSAAQGNFLEVLNISLNTFEHHYLNRNLDRTGQQSIVITPGNDNLDDVLLMDFAVIIFQCEKTRDRFRVKNFHYCGLFLWVK